MRLMVLSRPVVSLWTIVVVVVIAGLPLIDGMSRSSSARMLFPPQEGLTPLELAAAFQPENLAVIRKVFANTVKRLKQMDAAKKK